MSYAVAAYVVVLVGVAGYAVHLARERRSLTRALEAFADARSANRG